MKKIITIILTLFTLLMVTSCGPRVEDEEFQVIFYKYRNSYIDEEDKAKENVIFVKKGSKIEPLENNKRPGYAFLGWYKDPGFNDLWNFDNDTVEKSLVLYAKWEEAYYQLLLELNGGEFRDEFQGEYTNDGIPYFTYSIDDGTNLPRLTKTGYNFLGWFPDEEYIKGKTKNERIPSDLAEDTIFYGHWEVITSSVSFNLNTKNETNPKSINARTVDYGDTIDFPTPEDLTGEYTFVGWNSRNDGSGTYYNNGDIFERTVRITLYAIWEKNE